MVNIARVQPLFYPRRINIDTKESRSSHCSSQRLSTAHSAESAGNQQFMFQVTLKIFLATSYKCFVSSLQKRFRISRCLACAAINHEFFWIFGYLTIEVIE